MTDLSATTRASRGSSADAREYVFERSGTTTTGQLLFAQCQQTILRLAIDPPHRSPPLRPATGSGRGGRRSGQGMRPGEGGSDAQRGQCRDRLLEQRRGLVGLVAVGMPGGKVRLGDPVPVGRTLSSTDRAEDR